MTKRRNSRAEPRQNTPSSTMELKRGSPPPSAVDRGGRPPSKMFDNLVQLAETPGEWGQISSHPNKILARQVVYHLRGGQRRRPPGNWEFTYGPEEEDNPDSAYGVWARLTIEEKEGDSASPNAGREHHSR